MRRMARLGMVFFGILLVCSGPAKSGLAAGDFSKVDEILGARGQMQEGAWVVRFPRGDLKVSLNGEPVPAALGFGGWAAFKDLGKHTMVMGDLALLEKEVNPAISALEDNGLEVTALHNHFFYEEPRIMFMHFGGLGPKEQLAKGLRQALDKTATPKAPAVAAPAPTTSPLNINVLEKIVGHPGQLTGTGF